MQLMIPPPKHNGKPVTLDDLHRIEDHKGAVRVLRFNELIQVWFMLEGPLLSVQRIRGSDVCLKIKNPIEWDMAYVHHARANPDLKSFFTARRMGKSTFTLLGARKRHSQSVWAPLAMISHSYDPFVSELGL